MKKVKIIFLSLFLVMSFTMTSFAGLISPPDRSLKATTITGCDSSATPVVFPMANTIYTETNLPTGYDADVFDDIMNTGLTVGHMIDVHGSDADNVLLIGLYYIEPNVTDISALVKPLKYTITPSIYGFSSSTDFCVFQRIGLTWQLISSDNVTVNSGSIIVSTSETYTPFALVVDTSTLSNGGVVPPITPPGDEEEEDDGIDKWNITGIDKNGNEVSGIATGREGSVEGMDHYFREFHDSVLLESMLPSGADNIVLLHAMDIDMEKGVEFPVTITFDYPNVNENSKVYIFHLTSKIEWETIEAVVSNGKVTATFNSLSPVMIYADSSTLGSPEVPESPETGDDGYMYIIIGMIALGLISIMFIKQE